MQRPPRARPTGGEPPRPISSEDRAALWLLLILHVALEGALVWAAVTLANLWSGIQIASWQKVAFQAGIGITMLVFAVRTVRLWRRIRSG